jgi:hypothetical protein
MKKYFVMMIMLMLISQLFSYSLLDRYSGSYVNNIDARSSAMGGAGVSGGNRLFDVNLNPANLSFLPVGLGLQTGISVVKNDDNRSIPMYNFFDGYIDDATYVNNTNFYDEYSAAAYYANSCGNHTVSFGFFYLPYINFDSNYFEEVRNDAGSDYDQYPAIIAKNYMESSGGIYEKKFTASFNVNNIASIGVGISHLCGKSKNETRITATDSAPAIDDSLMIIKRNYDGFKLDVGTNIQLNPRLALGFNYTPEIDLNAQAESEEADVSYLAEFKSPSRTRLGMAYEPRNIMRTHFNIDAEYVSWAEINTHYDDVMNFYLGVEHHFKNTIPVRLGFNYITEYQIVNDEIVYADKILMPTFTAGTGFTVLENIIVDISGEFSNRKYETLDLFMDGHYADAPWNNIAPADRGWENPDLVEETFFKFKAGISYKW